MLNVNWITWRDAVNVNPLPLSEILAEVADVFREYKDSRSFIAVSHTTCVQQYQNVAVTGAQGNYEKAKSVYARAFSVDRV
jgi:hypothetical protein